jgi:hypothetical protein
MARWLRAGGWETTRSGIQMNVGCMESAIGAIEARLDEAVGRAGRRALLVGQSRGGSFGPRPGGEAPGPGRDAGHPRIARPRSDGDQPEHSGRGHPGRAAGDRGRARIVRPQLPERRLLRASKATADGAGPQDVRYIAFYSRQDPSSAGRRAWIREPSSSEVNGTHSGMGISRTVWERMAQLVPPPPSRRDDAASPRPGAIRDPAGGR